MKVEPSRWRGRDDTDDLRRHSDDGLSAYEREILRLWDSGRSLVEIMAETGRSRKAVRTVVENYDDRPDSLEPLRDANIRFVARLRQFHGALIGLRA